MIGLKCARMIIIIGVLSRLTSFETYKVVLTRLYSITYVTHREMCQWLRLGKSSSPVTSMFKKIISSFPFLLTFQISFFKLSQHSTYILHVLKWNKRRLRPSVCYISFKDKEVRQQLTGRLLSDQTFLHINHNFLVLSV